MATNLTSKTVCYKQPNEKFSISMDFGNWLGSETIVGTPTVDVVPSGELAVYGLTSLSGLVYATVASGIDHHDYRLEFVVTTSNDNIYCGDCTIKVREE